jgi:arginine repressor
MGNDSKSKMAKVLEFISDNPGCSQKEVREHFNVLGIKVSSSETSLAFKKMGASAKGRPKKPKSPNTAKIPVLESPALRNQMRELRKKNSQLKRVIDMLITDEEAHLRN